MQGVLSDDE